MSERLTITAKKWRAGVRRDERHRPIWYDLDRSFCFIRRYGSGPRPWRAQRGRFVFKGRYTSPANAMAAVDELEFGRAAR